MPTATTTTTTPASVISLKASPSPSSPSSSSAAATLRSLYPRAARAFLQRDVALTHSLISSASSLLTPPASALSLNDALASQRRKWDILRITFETTLYASPPPTHDPEHLPPTLRANLMLTPESLIATLHSRSLHLFTPIDSPDTSSSAFLPSQILVTLVLASLKLDCANVARGMIEHWLARYGQEHIATDSKGYVKIIELYCLHVLSRLQDWEYAEDFLTYERELPPDIREQYSVSLRQLRAQAAANPTAKTSLPSNSLSTSSASSRSASPAPSDTSASSSSTHTATPRAPRPTANGHARSPAPFDPFQSRTSKQEEQERERRGRGSPHSTSSQSIASTATSRTITPQSASRDRERTRASRGQKPARGAAAAAAHLADSGPVARGRGRERSATLAAASSSASVSASASTASTRSSVIHRASFVGPASAASMGTARTPSTLAVVRASVETVLRSASRAKVLAYVVLFVVLPLVSFVLRLRRRKVVQSGAAGAGGGAVDAVRRRLRGAEAQGGVRVVSRVWEEVARVVLDTVKMAGRGLV